MSWPARRRFEVAVLVALATIASAATYGLAVRHTHGIRERYARELEAHCRHARASAERGLVRIAQLAEHPRSTEALAFRDTVGDAHWRERWWQRCAVTPLPPLSAHPTIATLRDLLQAVVGAIPDATPQPREHLP